MAQVFGLKYSLPKELQFIESILEDSDGIGIVNMTREIRAERERLALNSLYSEFVVVSRTQIPMDASRNLTPLRDGDHCQLRLARVVPGRGHPTTGCLPCVLIGDNPPPVRSPALAWPSLSKRQSSANTSILQKAPCVNCIGGFFAVCQLLDPLLAGKLIGTWQPLRKDQVFEPPKSGIP
jgi:hypothetical protein